MTTAPPQSEQGLLSRWREVLRTTNPPEGVAHLDPVSRWLVLTRAAVLPMTLTAGIVGGLLAVRHPDFSWVPFLLALVGVVLAHAANNLMNDLWDLEVGLDSMEYPRGLYAPHPILSGMTTKWGLARAALIVNVLDLAILVALVALRGWGVVGFALAGLFLSIAYTAPPLRLKKHGLGEPDVLIVWGPLMVGGTYFAATGSLPWQVVAASLPYGLLCTAVLMGKHVDKIPWDTPSQVHTIPVLLGERRALTLTRVLMSGFYVTLAVGVVIGALPWPALAALAALPTLFKVWPTLGAARPAEAPPRWRIWPLWYSAFAFVHTRRAGALLVLGLLVAAALDITPFH